MISLIYPTYNARPFIDATWDSTRDFLRYRRDDWEVLYVCDGCTDGTLERLSALHAEADDDRIRVVSYDRNRGKGYAVRVGMLAARGAYRVFTDVDLAYRFDDIARVADELRDGATVAIASREHADSQIQLTAHCLGYVYRRSLQSRAFGSLARWMLPLETRDSQAGLKGMTAAVADAVVPNLRCDGFGFDCELLTACARYGVPVTEVPVCVRYGDATSSTGGVRTIARMVTELWRVRRMWPATGFPPMADVKEPEYALTAAA